MKRPARMPTMIARKALMPMAMGISVLALFLIPPISRIPASHKPIEIRLKREEKALEIDFDDSRSFHYPAEFLRVESPSAEVQGHGPGQKKLVSGRRHVGIMDLIPVGNYAVCINDAIF